MASEEPQDRVDAAAVLPQLYDELRRLAASHLRGQQPGHTLQPTALVHEAWMRLAQADDDGRYRDRAHVFAVAAKALRQILVDHARRRGAAKRGGTDDAWRRLTLAGLGGEVGREIDVLDLEAALDRLAVASPRPARVAELRFFAGLEVAEVAAALEVSEKTIKNDWRFARAWLRRALDGEDGPS